MYHCVVFVLQSYLNRVSDDKVTLLSAGCAAHINEQIDMYRDALSHYYGSLSCECGFVIMLKIRCGPAPATKRKYIQDISKVFFSWISEFMSLNGLRFPCAGRLFSALMLCALSGSMSVESDFPTADSIIRKLLSELLTHWVRTTEELRAAIKDDSVCQIVCRPNEGIEYKDRCCERCSTSGMECCKCVCCAGK